ncbi:MAG: AAA family ATPase, partial [Nitrospirae bacterium]|nr:AAA family ATPase [Nitrospirota bacterium]
MLGQLINNRYQIIEQLGEGVLSTVYKAVDLKQNLTLAIKVLKEKTSRSSLESILRFKKRLQDILGLSHNNLAKVYEVLESEGLLCIAMEYLRAQPLSFYLNRPPLNIAFAVEVILQTANCLAYVYKKGIYHGLLKPTNILILTDEYQTTVKLTDFGLNLLLDLTQIKEKKDIVSVFGYLAPEQTGILRKNIDHRCDIYSLGIIFYQLATARLPYEAEDVSGLIYQHIAKTPPLPSQLNPQIPFVLEKLIHKQKVKDIQDRYQSFEGLVSDLQEYKLQSEHGRTLIDFEIARLDHLKELTYQTRLIGREEELKQLRLCMDETRESKGSICLVYGEPGVGKSRLVDELRGYAHSQNAIFVGSRCSQYEFRAPYRVFTEAIESYIDKLKRLSQEAQEAASRRIKQALGELGREVVKITPKITELIGEPPKLAELEPEKEKIRFLITITNFLVSLASKDNPLVIFLDDLQWIDETSLELLERLSEKLSHSPIFIIISFRDNEVDETHPLSQLIKRLKETKQKEELRLSELSLKNLSLSQTTQLISELLMEKREYVLGLAQHLEERTKGNPFFSLELIHALVDSGLLYLKDDHYTYDLRRLKQAILPTSIVDAVLKRIKDLAAEALHILSYASVIGKEINLELLIELTQKPFDTVLNSLEEGIKNQLLMRDITGRENIYFIHDRVREAFYQKLPKEERLPLHKQVAMVLEERNQDKLEAILYDLAYHFTQAEIDDKALLYSIRAGHKAKASYANIQAINLYLVAQQLLEKQQKTKTEQYIEVLENLGEVYRLAGRFEESIQTLRTCESLISSQDKIHKAQITSKIVDTLFEKGETDDSIKALEQTLELLNVKIPQTRSGVILGILF